MSSLYRTPARGVSTRSMTRRNDDQQGKPLEVPDQQLQENSSQLKTENHRLETEMLLETKKNILDQTMDLDAGRNLTAVAGPSKARAATVKSKSKSTASSKSAQRKKLELEAAEAKARIQMELIDRRLAADLADLEYSSQSEEEEDPSRVVVEKWLERSHQDLEAHPVLQSGNLKDETCAPPPPAPSAPPAAAGTDATVHMLACALKNLSTANTIGGTNSKMLSRLCTPRDLPSYSGDPMEWLSFKQAYYESTEVCNFSNKENLWRLRKCLHGPAKEAVSALLITATSPENVISTLELQFGNSDLIISRILLDIKKLPTMSHDYHKEIVKFSVKVQNYVAAVLALGQEEYLRGMNIVSLILSKMPTLLLSKWVDYSYPLLKDTSKLKLVVLSDFLSDEAVKVSQTAVNVVSLRNEVSLYKRKPFEDNRAQTVLAQSDQSDFSEKCRFCRVSVHSLPDCKIFKKALRKDRWRHVKRNGICFKCLITRHDKQSCLAPVCDKDGCGQHHHRLLHFIPNSSHPVSNVNITELDPEPRVESVTHITADCKVLLQTVPVFINGPNGVIKTIALLDGGSTVSLISASLAARAGLRGHKQTMRIRGAWNATDLLCDSYVLDFNLSDQNGTLFNIKTRSVHELNLPVQNILLSAADFAKFKIPAEIKNQLDLKNGQLKPELLIGQDNFHLLLPLQVLKCDPDGFYATRTPLGWTVHGCVRSSILDNAAKVALFITDGDGDASSALETTECERILQELHDEIRQSFSLESMGVCSKPRQNEDDLKAWNQLEASAILIGDRWHVGLPWKNANSKWPDSFPNALKRLQNSEKKMQADQGYAERYTERINHLFENDFAEEVTNTTATDKTWYLPHFGVDNPNKKKLRLVFDAAAKSRGQSLNSFLLTGPDLLMSLLGIMFRFRENRIAVTADIKDMFLRVKILPEDRNALRFLWTPNNASETAKKPEEITPVPTPPVRTYAMSSLIFGASCSPFIAQFVKNKNAQRFEKDMPEAVKAICSDHYMDDYIQSISEEKSAVELIHQITKIHKEGGFEIRNWTSNSQKVLETIPNEALGTTAVKFKIGQQTEGERTLGLIWFPNEDNLGFDVSFKKLPQRIVNGEKRPTKREMLKVISSIFDVYGLLSPFTVRGKIMMQQTWRAGIKWDEMIDDKINEQWVDWLYLLKSIDKIRLPRYYPRAALGTNESSLAPSAPDRLIPTQSSLQDNVSSVPIEYKNLQLHMFCDSSTKAMCAVGYWRWEDTAIHVAFIASKCRVAPANHAVSVPRLELQAAVLAVRLADTIEKEHNIKPTEKYYWSDSATVLHWIKNRSRDYKVFVAHRLGEIDELSRDSEWRYIPTQLNVADLATRNHCDVTVFENEWFNGPRFLYENPELWPTDITQPKVSLDDLEFVNTIAVTPENLPCVPEPLKFSSWLRLLKSTCVMLSFADKTRRLRGDIDGDMLKRAELLLLKRVQAESFPEELDAVKNKKNIKSTSRILTLSPFLDNNEVLRAEGRINAAPEIEMGTKQPVILDGRHHITRLIVSYFHVRAAHGNQETVVNELKQKYWITRVRPTVKGVAAKCTFCRIRKAQPQPPRMGDLPEARLSHHTRPFSFCGLDLFGPLEVTVARHREKRYGVLFTCLTVIAVHIEIVNSLSTDALIMALRRMAARRGWPLSLFSDNGSNLRGADNELKMSIQELDQKTLKSEALNYGGTTWSFIPPASPHWGGAWERLIRSVKTSLKVVLKERAPRDETLRTLMAEVEQIVNSRPLTHVSVEPHSNETLTPNHFLIGSSSNLPVLGKFEDFDLRLRKQWRISQRLSDMFWKRWLKEILPDMIPRRKWTQEQKPLQVGNFVLIVDPNSPRNVWPKGVIEKVMPGKDGRIRVVDVRTQTGLFRRPATRIARVALEEC